VPETKALGQPEPPVQGLGVVSGGTRATPCVRGWEQQRAAWVVRELRGDESNERNESRGKKGNAAVYSPSPCREWSPRSKLDQTVGSQARRRSGHRTRCSGSWRTRSCSSLQWLSSMFSCRCWDSHWYQRHSPQASSSQRSSGPTPGRRRCRSPPQRRQGSRGQRWRRGLKARVRRMKRRACLVGGLVCSMINGSVEGGRLWSCEWCVSELHTQNESSN
jgi:hypothetical protein